MTQTAYLVTAGSFDDYHVAAIFLDRASAEEFINGAANQKDEDAPRIEEFPIGEQPEGRFEKTYRVTISQADGSLVSDREAYEQHPPLYSTAAKWASFREQRVCGVSVVSREHALKVAEEERQKILRGLTQPADSQFSLGAPALTPRPRTRKRRTMGVRR